MALLAGKGCKVTINTVDFSAYITNVSIDLKGKTLVDITAMGADGKAWASDEINDVSFTIDFLFDDTAGSGSWVNLEGFWDSDAAVAFEIFLDGTGAPSITGNCFLETLPIAVAIGDVIRVNGVVFRVVGAPIVTP